MSQMTMDAVVKDVEVRTTKNGHTIYDVILEDGSKWTAFDEPLAKEAFGLKGKPSTLEVSVTEKGNYTNRNVNSIRARGTGASQNGGSTSFAPTSQPFNPGGGTSLDPIGVFAPAATPEVVFSPAGTTPTPTDIVIWRQVATKVAAQISKSDLEFWANVDTLIHYYQTGEKPNMLQTIIESGAVQVGTGGVVTPQDAPPAYSDSDIPF